MEKDARQRAAFFRRGIDAETAPGVMQINENAAAFGGNGFERPVNNFAAIAGERTEDISREAVRMNAHERRLAAREFAAREGDMQFVVHFVGESNHAKFAVTRGQNRLRDALDVTLMLH